MYTRFYNGALFLAIFFIFSTTPVVVNAQSIPASTDRAQLLAQIHFLLEKIEILQAQIAQQSTDTSYPYWSDDTYEIVDTFYYGKDFESVYEISTSLNLLRRDADTKTRTIDKDLWNMFTDIIGTNAAKRYIAEFRVFNDKHSNLGGFVELPAGKKDWIVAFNRDDFDRTDYDSEEIYEALMIHEYAHIITFYMDDFVDSFTDEFWTRSDTTHARRLQNLDQEERDQALQTYYSNHSKDFVSDYATYSPEEDIAETFVTFVLKKKPVHDNYKKNQKILSMYASSKLRTLRSELRYNLGLD